MEKNVIKLLEKDITKKHLSKHEFYKLWNEGRVSLDALRAYAQQYYYFVSEFPRFVSRVHSNTPYQDDRTIILENLNDEEGKVPHADLWLRFASGLGLKKNEINAEMLPETREMLNKLRKLTSKNFLEGAAALLAYEAQISEIAGLKMQGLKKYYNLKDDKALKFFRVHSKVDIEHQKTWKRLIARNAKTKLQRKMARTALNSSLKAMWLMLDGIYKRYC